MFVLNKRVLEIFVMLIFGVTALSTMVGVENVAGGSVVKLGFPFAFYEQVCAAGQCTSATSPLMLVPNMLIYFAIAAGFVNFREMKKQKKTSATAPLLTGNKKTGFSLFKKKQHNKSKVPTFFEGKDAAKQIEKPVAAAKEKDFEYKPSKYDIADEEPLFTKEEVKEMEDDE